MQQWEPIAYRVRQTPVQGCSAGSDPAAEKGGQWVTEQGAAASPPCSSSELLSLPLCPTWPRYGYHTHHPVESAPRSGSPDLIQMLQMGWHFGFKHKDGRFCSLSGRGLLSVLYCSSYTNWRKLWVLSRRAISNGTSICHVLILSTGRNLCSREWFV